MQQEQYTKLVDAKLQQYVDWGYDKWAIVHEENMIKGTPSSYFAGGADEKQATLHALDLLETKLS